MRFLIALGVFFSVSAAADWQLDQTQSSLNFISTKNTDISEMHSFDKFTGSLTESGALSVAVDLSSVNTLIEIRNTRMREMLFKVNEFASADFTAQLPESVLKKDIGTQTSLELQGQLSLHGVTLPVTMHLNIVKLGADTFAAHTVKPIILNAGQFNLEAGVTALRTIAGLNTISLAVPVSFSVVFKR